MNEKQLIETLKSHLRIAESWNWKFEKVVFCDGFLQAMNIATGKNYKFSGTNVYVVDDNGNKIIV
jgi:hypothetical protein